MTGYKRPLGPCTKRQPTCPPGSHDRWELIVSLGRDPLTGRYPQRSRTFHGSERQADKQLARIATEVDDGKHRGALSTVTQLIDRWLNEVEPDMSPYTVRRYRSLIDNHITPAIGSQRITKVQPPELATLYRDLKERRKLGASSVRQIHAILRGAFGLAVAWGWLDSSPAAKTKPPKAPARKIESPSLEDVRRGLEAAVDYTEEFGVFYWLAVAIGARRGELCALRWSDFTPNLDATLISRSLTIAKTGEVYAKDTKTHQERAVALDPGTTAVLLEHRRKMTERAAKGMAILGPDAHVFSNDIDCARPWHPDTASTAFQRIKERAGLPFRLHDLRHFSVTRGIAAGYDPVTVAERHGHRDPSVTMRVYASAIEANDRQLAQHVGGLLLPAKTADVPDEGAS